MVLTILFLFIASLCFSKKSNRNSEYIVLAILVFVPFLLIYKASDFSVYHDYYSRIEPLYKIFSKKAVVFWTDHTKMEWGYVILNSFFKIFSNKIELMYFTINLIVLFIISKFIKDKSVNFFLLLLPYFVFLYISIQMGIIRQMIAITIFLLSTKYILNSNFWKFFLSILIAFIFHRTAIFLLPLYFIVRKNYRNISLILFVLFCIVFYFTNLSYVILHFIEYFSKLFPYGMVGEKIRVYIWDLKQTPIKFTFTIGFFEELLVCTVILFTKNKLINENSYDDFTNLSVNLALLQSILFYTTSNLGAFGYRITYYLILFKFFVFVKLIESFKNKNNRYIGILILILYCAFKLAVRIYQGY